MSYFDAKKLTNNYKEIIKEIAALEGHTTKNMIETYIDTTKKVINSWSFEDLDKFYEEGIIEKDASVLPDELWDASVGYALLVRYNLSLEEYVEWARKQEDTYYLLKLVDVKCEKGRGQIGRKLSDIDLEGLYDELESKKTLIEYTDSETEITLFGGPIAIKDNAKKIVELYSCLSKAKEYSLTIFNNEFKSQCVDYKECAENIEIVLKDACDAGWMKCKRFLLSKAIPKEMVDKIYKEYKGVTQEIYSVKDLLSDMAGQLIDIMQGKAKKIVLKEENSSSMEFYGGGQGIGGAISGMIGVSVMSSLSSLTTEMRTKLSESQLKKEFDKKINELYVGENTIKIYYQLVEAANSELAAICRKVLFAEDVEEQSKAEVVIKIIRESSDKMNGEQLRRVASDLLFIYPCTFSAYEFLLDYFVGIRKELEKVAKCFELEKNILKKSSKLFWRSKNKLVFDDMLIDLSKNGMVTFDSLQYCGFNYKITFPLNKAFFDESALKFLPIGSISKDFYMANIKTKDVIRIWGGYEGEEVYAEEIQQNNAQILEKVNGFENIRIRDFSQNVDIRKAENYYMQFLHADLLFGEIYHDVFMLTYLDKEVYFSICIGNVENMGENIQVYKDILEGIKIEKIDKKEKGEFDFLTYSEVIGCFQSDKEKIAEQYRVEHRNEIDMSFALLFRKRFKVLVMGGEYTENVVNEYDYSTYNEDIINTMEQQAQKGQYVLYFSENIIVTDFNIIIFNGDGKGLQIAIKDICEILPIEEYLSGVAPRMCVRLLNGEAEVIYVKKEMVDEYIYICDLVNIALDVLVNPDISRFYREAHFSGQDGLIFCEKCKKVTNVRIESGKVLNHFYCNNCNAERKYINRIMKDKFIQNMPIDLKDEMDIFEGRGEFLDEETYAKKYDILLPNIDVKKESRVIREREDVKKYISKNIYHLDYEIAVLYRSLFKIIFSKYVKKENIVNCYDYELDSGILRNFMKSQKQKGQYILYSGNGLIITDFNIYINTNRGSYNFALQELVEILPMENYYGSDFEGICIRSKKDIRETKLILDDLMKKNSPILDLINIVLEKADIILKNPQIIRYYQSPYIEGERIAYCGNCNHITYLKMQPMGIVNKIFCNNCLASATAIKSKFYTVVCSKDIAEKKNGLDAKILGKEQLIVESELQQDKNENGLLEMAFDLIGAEKDEHKNITRKSIQIDGMAEVLKNIKMFCPYCGKQINRSSKFCNFCGQKNTYDGKEN